jgi:addiction module HigA family antidote
MANANLIAPIHPGETLLEDWMKPHDISINQLAEDLGVDKMRISRIVNGKLAITAETAIRLGRYFGNSPQFWMNLQSLYEIQLVERSKDIAKIVTIRKTNFPQRKNAVGVSKGKPGLQAGKKANKPIHSST